jgi:hypothetical protein
MRLRTPLPPLKSIWAATGARLLISDMFRRLEFLAIKFLTSSPTGC